MNPLLFAAAEGLAATGHLVHPGAIRLEGARTEQLRLLRGRKPEEFYPARARAEHIDGTVIVDLLINAEGMVQEAQVISESPPGRGFGLAALDAAKTYEYDNPLHRLVLMAIVVGFEP